eukprot:NODE_6073_length_882_cov_109.179183_g5843_i0.p1 GENE.NODE_6073_length_882_cov_109.179183_g5843_i0~~NODE_6073_length_882_cov_109.179183_g5843_i0.p1  ORF type:complete len:244 (-),score=14.21 NODE_6073_length_882_cov_109.179183_g5843_i0:5-736(-)
MVKSGIALPPLYSPHAIAFAADALELTVRALNASLSFIGDDAARAIRSTTFEGLTGTVTLDTLGDRSDRNARYDIVCVYPNSSQIVVGGVSNNVLTIDESLVWFPGHSSAGGVPPHGTPTKLFIAVSTDYAIPEIVQGVWFAAQDINNKMVNPNLLVDFQINVSHWGDTGRSFAKALESMENLVKTNVGGIIGGWWPDFDELMAPYVSLNQIPQVSFSAYDLLTDKARFSHHLHGVPTSRTLR